MRFLVTKYSMGMDRDLWIEYYIEFMKKEGRYDWDATGEEYCREVAGKIFDWIGDDACWLYGDHFYEVVDYKEWKETGTRYTG